MNDLSNTGWSQESEINELPCIATVTALFLNPTGTAQVRFDGDETASEKKYAYLSSYKPAVNDRVIMLPIAGTYIILGKILFNTSPPSSSSLTVTSLTVTDSFNHSGGWLGFFGKGSVTNKTSVSDPSSITTTESVPSTYTSTAVNMLNHLKTDVTNLQSKLKTLIDVLQNYNLV